MDDKEKLKELAVSIWEKSKKDTKLVFLEEEHFSPGTYEYYNKTIIIRLNVFFEKTKKEAEQEGIEITDEDLLSIIVAHEIGHSEDEKLVPNSKIQERLGRKITKDALQYKEKRMVRSHKKFNQIMLRNEMVAWENAKKYFDWTKDENHIKIMEFFYASYVKNCKPNIEKWIVGARAVKIWDQVERSNPELTMNRVTFEQSKDGYGSPARYTSKMKEMELRLPTLIRKHKEKAEYLRIEEYAAFCMIEQFVYNEDLEYKKLDKLYADKYLEQRDKMKAGDYEGMMALLEERKQNTFKQAEIIKAWLEKSLPSYVPRWRIDEWMKQEVKGIEKEYEEERERSQTRYHERHSKQAC